MMRRVRPVLIWLHRWVGLTVGLLFTVVSVSGSLLLFQPWFFTWAHGDLIPPHLSPRIGSVDQWVENARRAVPELGNPIAIWPPHVEHNISDAAMLIFQGLPPGGLGNMGFAGVLVAPATGEVLGVVDIDRSPAYAPLFLHRDLWAGQTGQIVSGVMAIGTLLLLVIGLYLWWPALSRLPRRLSPRPWRTTFMRARPLHDWIGAWTFVFLVILTATGLSLVRGTWVSPVLDTVVGPEPSEPVHDEAACGTPMGYDAAIVRAQQLVPAGTWRSVYPADLAATRWEITFAEPGSDALHRETHVIANLDCGTVAVEATPETRSAREATELWIAGLHDGTAFGTPGTIVVAILGLSPLVLMWSGVLMWLRRNGWIASAARARRVAFESAPQAEALRD